jgi:hypothetical protein
MVRMRGNIVMYDDVVVMCGVEVGYGVVWRWRLV